MKFYKYNISCNFFSLRKHITLISLGGIVILGMLLIDEIIIIIPDWWLSIVSIIDWKHLFVYCCLCFCYFWETLAVTQIIICYFNARSKIWILVVHWHRINNCIVGTILQRTSLVIASAIFILNTLIIHPIGWAFRNMINTKSLISCHQTLTWVAFKLILVWLIYKLLSAYNITWSLIWLISSAFYVSWSSCVVRSWINNISLPINWQYWTSLHLRSLHRW